MKFLSTTVMVVVMLFACTADAASCRDGKCSFRSGRAAVKANSCRSVGRVAFRPFRVLFRGR